MRHIPGPALALAFGLVLLWVMARTDGAQSARLLTLDRQQEQATQDGLRVAQSRKAVQAAHEAAQAEIARQRGAQTRIRADLAVARHRGDSLGSIVAAVLAGQPDSVAGPVRDLLATKDSMIGALGRLLASDSVIVDRLTADRDRWMDQAGKEAGLAAAFQRQAGAYRSEARRGCWPILGCLNRSLAFGLGAVAGVLAARALP